MSEIESTDRYGGNPPDPETMCKGECEGMGWVPVQDREHAGDLIVDSLGYDKEPWKTLWQEAHIAAGEHECDGWHFVKCPDCGGTGKGQR